MTRLNLIWWSYTLNGSKKLVILLFHYGCKFFLAQDSQLERVHLLSVVINLGSQRSSLLFNSLHKFLVQVIELFFHGLGISLSVGFLPKQDLFQVL